MAAARTRPLDCRPRHRRGTAASGDDPVGSAGRRGDPDGPSERGRRRAAGHRGRRRRAGHRIGEAARRRAGCARGGRMGGRHGDGGERRGRRRQCRFGGLRASRHDARLPAGGPRALPRDVHDRRLRGSSPAGPDRALDLRVRGAEQDQRLPGGLRFLRAGPHHGRDPGRGVRDPRRSDPPEGARHGDGSDSSPVGGQVRLAPGRSPRRAARRSGRARRCPGPSRRSAPARWR